jgi:uncharacterized protein (DUF779 family)
MMTITKKSMMTGNLNTMTLNITMAQFEAWKGGVLIQQAMPDLSPAEREFIMTGTTDEEWKEAFGDAL